ncbi:MAG TPA: CcoQ/FixQ family Cbb3-type cytochrome c oxidase assembly chaperone [Hyphomonas sp.]|nr:CcoQ/FixQ family Cbb3-type cytochrome c oxidase assembly chaperone [Hyphomonas sp.]
MDYNEFRYFAVSWGLLYLFVLFVGILTYTFWPGGKKKADDAANIPLKDD